MTRDITDGDLRLAAQHPFPAQGHTTDTTDVIVGEHATREGSYVALTRARTTTDLYATTSDPEPGQDRLTTLAGHLSRTQPNMPSIHLPLDHARENTPTPRPERTPEPTSNRDANTNASLN